MADLSDQITILLQTLLAILLGGMIGFERQVKDRPAGLRTHMLVAASATLYTSLGILMTDVYNLEVGSNAVEADPIRVTQAILTGVSFLGAGTIIRRGGNDVTGLTTAASLLTTAAIGIAVAISQFTLAIGATVIVLIILYGVNLLEVRFNVKDEEDTSENN
jgi:putative Mg2+ transporter-C (MgtC) family protein